MKKINILLTVFIISSTLSCEDFLELEPISDATTSNAYETGRQIEAALVGAYSSFQAEYYVWDFLLFQDVRSDNCYAGGDNPEITEIDLLKITPTNSRLFTNWSNLYNAIQKTNVVLERVDEINDPTLTEERREEIKGEAYFLRAYHYFTLVKLWGGVPIITTTISSADDNTVNVPRASVQEVYNQIISDLEQAAMILPDLYGQNDIDKARATSGAANALAAKVYAQQPIPDYEAVLSHIQAVESSTANYQLISSYSQLFDSNDNNAESIIEVQYTGLNEGNFGPQLLLPPSITQDTWRKFVTPSHDVVNAFDAEGDVVRKNAAILFESIQTIDQFWGNARGSSVPFSYKWKNASGFASADNTYLLRYGDMVLLKAEALNELNQLQAAIAEVNKIRNRAQLPNLTLEQSNSKEVLRTSILKERRLELFIEGHRWDDLVRYNALITTMNNLVETDLRTNNLVIYNMTEAKKLLPIPQEELGRNPALVQNPL